MDRSISEVHPLRMRMQFGADDGMEFWDASDGLLPEYERWLEREPSSRGDVDDAREAMDWKWEENDGDLGTWTVADLDGFLLDWCPRELSILSTRFADFPPSIGTFCTFLADRGLLSARSDQPDVLRGHCERIGADFVRAMSDPGRYGAKKQSREQDFQRALEKIRAIPVEDKDEPVLRVGPVRYPDAQQRAESAAAAPVVEQLHRLREHCSAPGLPLTQEGDLQPDDVRRLMERLGPTLDDHLDWLVTLAVDAGVLCRRDGRLVADAGWADVDPVAAQDRLVDAAVGMGLAGHGHDAPGLSSILRYFDDCGPVRLVADLICFRAIREPMQVEGFESSLHEMSRRVFPHARPVHGELVRSWARRQVNRLAALGVLTVVHRPGAAEGGLAELTPGGVAVAVRLAESSGIVVLAQPDPETATAADLVDRADRVPPEEWEADVTAWARHDAGRDIARDLVAELNDPELDGSVVLWVLSQLSTMTGEHASPAVATMLHGPHDGLAIQWLLRVGAISYGDVTRERLSASSVEMLEVALQDQGPQRVVAIISGGSQADQITRLERISQVDRPGTAAILEAVGAHHPDRAVAESARKYLQRHRAQIANKK